MNNSYITIIKEKRTALSRKRIPLNQNGCTANFRIGVPFEQNLQYWTSNYELVKEMMSQAEVYVYEDDKMIQGFVGLSNEYIEGIFVSDEMQSCGIGKLLLDYIKNKKVRLRLNVYQKNARALSFYQREGFDIQSEGLLLEEI